MPGVSVHVPDSDHSRLVLTNVTRFTGGVYRCEVSSEAPYFYTAVNSLRVNVSGVLKNIKKI